MPIIKSAKKRVRVAHKAAVRNSKTKRVLKSALKVFGRRPSAASQSAAQSSLDKAVKKGVMHKNKAARMKKQLANRAKAAGTKTVTSKKAAVKKLAPKAAAKKSPVKKAKSKKPATKKK